MMRLLLTSDLHRDGCKLLWLMDSAPQHEALLVSGDLLDIFSDTPMTEQTSGALRWKESVRRSGKAVAWCSGNHDFFYGDQTPVKSASPLWMREEPTSRDFVTDGDSAILKAGKGQLAVTSVPWPVHGGTILHNGQSISYNDYVRDLCRAGRKLQFSMPWIMLCHEPPGDTPLAGSYVAIEADFSRQLIESAQPDFSLHGHIHQAPTAPGGSWIWQLGKTICFNPGQSEKGEPPHCILLEWHSPENWSAEWHAGGKSIRAVAGSLPPA